MGARGPAPREGSVTRHQPKQRRRTIEAARVDPPELLGCELPATLAWWAAWRDSPQAHLFTATDWQSLLRGALLVEAFYTKPTAQLAAEIRQIESKLGATLADRDRLGLRLEEPAPSEESPRGETAPSRERPDPRRA